MATQEIVFDEAPHGEALQKVDPFQRATPGQSLTNDPDSPKPFEGAPRFTDVHNASMSILNDLTSKEAYIDTMTSIGSGTPVSDVAAMIVMEGFRNGAWNPDLMMLLYEPTVYMLIALAEKADIEYVLDRDDRFEKDELDPEEETKLIKSGLDKMRDVRPMRADSLSQDIQQSLEKSIVPTEEVKERGNNQSLLTPDNVPKKEDERIKLGFGSLLNAEARAKIDEQRQR